MTSKGEGAAASTPRRRNNAIDVGLIRRKQIVSAVRRVIAMRGIDAVTIANISEELGTSRGVVVYHFKNKEEILTEVLNSAMNDAEESAHRLENGMLKSIKFKDVILQTSALAQSSNDWWKIYFAFLAQSHVNRFYRDILAWSDQRYRRTLEKRLGSTDRATIVLALMKGLAMQASVDPTLNLESSIEHCSDVFDTWERHLPGEKG